MTVAALLRFGEMLMLVAGRWRHVAAARRFGAPPGPEHIVQRRVPPGSRRREAIRLTMEEAAAATIPLRGRVSMRLRTAKDRLKVEHSIISGLRPVLESLLAANPEIQTIIPGVIRPVRNARGPVKMHITTPTQTGWKAIALAGGARQELFVTTKLSQQALDAAIRTVLKG